MFDFCLKYYTFAAFSNKFINYRNINALIMNTRKRVFQMSMMALTLVSGLVACDDSDEEVVPPEVVVPTLEAEVVEVGQTSAVFEVNAAHVDEVCYLLQKADEELPSTSEVLAGGTPVEDTQTTLENLEEATAYRVLVAARNDSLGVELSDTLDFTTTSRWTVVEDFTSEHTLAWWYGEYADGTDQFFLQLSTAEADPYTASPQEGGEMMRFYVFAPSTSREDIQLAPGTYTLGGDTNESGTFWRDGSVCAYGTTADDWMQVGFKSGQLTVAYANGTYTIEADVVLNDGVDTEVKASYRGELTIENVADGFHHFYGEVPAQVMNGAGGYVSASSAEGMDCYTLSLYNTPVDADGFVAGAGYVAQVTLYTEALPYGEFNLQGHYTANADWETEGFFAGTFISGFIYDMWGIKLPQGTFLSYYGNNGSIEMAGMAMDGTVDIEQQADGTYRIEADLTTDTGAHLSFSYEGEMTLDDQRNPSRPAQTGAQEPSLFPKPQVKKIAPLRQGWQPMPR